MSQDVTTDERTTLGPTEVVFLDPATTKVELADDDDGLFLVLYDAGTVIHFPLPREAEAGGLVRNLGWAVVGLVPEVRAKTLGYRAEHGPFNGPGALGPIAPRNTQAS